MFEGLLQPMHLLVILIVAMVAFGPKKLPELGKGIGEGIRSLKEGMKDQPAQDQVKHEATTEVKRLAGRSQFVVSSALPVVSQPF